MDAIWITLGILLIIAGIAGSLLPILPGTPLAFAGLMVQLLRDPDPFTAKFLWIWAGLTLLSILLDYLIPIWGTKAYGGTKYGVWGTTIGFMLSFWMGPLGLVSAFIGAFIGEMIAGQGTRRSMKAAWGSFLGFLLGTFLKLVLCGMMLYYVIRSI